MGLLKWLRGCASASQTMADYRRKGQKYDKNMVSQCRVSPHSHSGAVRPGGSRRAAGLQDILKYQ